MKKITNGLVVVKGDNNIEQLKDKPLLSFKKYSKNNQDLGEFVIDFDTATKNICVFGGTGTGKTTSICYPVLYKFLKNDCAGLVLDIKGGYSGLGRALKQKFPGKIDILGVSSDCEKINLIAGINKLKFRDLLKEVSESFHKENKYWGSNAIEDFVLMFEIMTENEENHQVRNPTLADFYYFYGNIKYLTNFAKNNTRLQNKIEERICNDNFSIFNTDLKGDTSTVMEQRTWQFSALLNFLRPFYENNYIREYFCSSDATSYEKKVYDENRVMILDFPSSEFGETALHVSRILRIRFKNVVKARGESWLQSNGYGRTRFTFMIIDEYQQYLCKNENVDSDDNNWFDTSRGYGHINILSTQSVDSFISKSDTAYTNQLIGNFRNIIHLPTHATNSLVNILDISGDYDIVDTLKYPQEDSLGYIYIGQNKKRVNERGLLKTCVSKDLIMNYFITDEFKENNHKIVNSIERDEEADCFIYENPLLNIDEKLFMLNEDIHFFVSNNEVETQEKNLQLLRKYNHDLCFYNQKVKQHKDDIKTLNGFNFNNDDICIILEDKNKPFPSDIHESIEAFALKGAKIFAFCDENSHIHKAKNNIEFFSNKAKLFTEIGKYSKGRNTPTLTKDFSIMAKKNHDTNIEAYKTKRDIFLRDNPEKVRQFYDRHKQFTRNFFEENKYDKSTITTLFTGRVIFLCDSINTSIVKNLNFFINHKNIKCEYLIVAIDSLANSHISEEDLFCLNIQPSDTIFISSSQEIDLYRATKHTQGFIECLNENPKTIINNDIITFNIYKMMGISFTRRSYYDLEELLTQFELDNPNKTQIIILDNIFIIPYDNDFSHAEKMKDEIINLLGDGTIYGLASKKIETISYQEAAAIPNWYNSITVYTTADRKEFTSKYSKGSSKYNKDLISFIDERKEIFEKHKELNEKFPHLGDKTLAISFLQSNGVAYDKQYYHFSDIRDIFLISIYIFRDQNIELCKDIELSDEEYLLKYDELVSPEIDSIFIKNTYSHFFKETGINDINTRLFSFLQAHKKAFKEEIKGFSVQIDGKHIYLTKDENTISFLDKLNNPSKEDLLIFEKKNLESYKALTKDDIDASDDIDDIDDIDASDESVIVNPSNIKNNVNDEEVLSTSIEILNKHEDENDSNTD